MCGAKLRLNTKAEFRLAIGYLSSLLGPTKNGLLHIRRTAVGKRRSSEEKLQIIGHARLLTFRDIPEASFIICRTRNLFACRFDKLYEKQSQPKLREFSNEKKNSF